MDEGDELSELVEGRIVNIFYLFSQAENYVKEVVADRVVLKRMFVPYTEEACLIPSRCSERSATNDPSTPDYDAQIY